MFALALVAALFAQPLASPHATDLVVEAKLTSVTLKVGDPIEVKMSLLNRGKSKLAVVKPGDGSESNWREPYVWFTAEREQGGKWVPVSKAQVGRCGLYDHDWDKDTVVLAPGERLTLKDWIDNPTYSVALDQPGRYRMQVHYAYGQAARSQIEPKGAMKGVAPFEVVSAPMSFELTKP